MADEENKHAGGRPPIFETPDKLEAACKEYIAGNPGKLTVTGLAMWLGFCDRQSLYDYEKKQEFSCIIKAARLAVENDYELALKSTTCTGAIFALKNMGWKDKTETALTDSDGNALPPAVINVYTTPKQQPKDGE